MTELSLSEKSELAEINRLHDELAQSIEKFVRVGALLTRAKAKVAAGEWGGWMAANLKFSADTARRYMVCFENRDRLKAAKIEFITDAYKLLKSCKNIAPKTAPVRQGFVANQPLPTENQVSDSSPIPAAAEPVIDLDDTGYPVPKSVLSIWQRRGDIDEILTHLKAVKLRLEKAMTDGDKLFIEANPTGSISDVTRLATTIACGKPYAVCTQCQGHPEIQPKGECVLCKGKGFISKFKWQTVPDNLKKIREKMGKK